MILEPITLAEAKRSAQQALATSRDSPERESELLIEKVTGLTRTQQLLKPTTLLTEPQQQYLAALLDRCLTGEPLAYVLGEWGFWTLQLRVTPAVLIPRPETEGVVERALQHLPVGIPSRVLDLGTGSGAIALAIASERPLAQVTGTDLSAPALQVASDNAQRCGIPNVQFQQSSWYETLSNERFEVIASNPPYIATNDPDVQESVRHYEPHTALYAGASGLDALTEIAQGASHFLTPGGWLVLEHGWQQAAAVRGLLESAGFGSVASHADLAGHERVTEGQWLPGLARPTT